jgi:YidC/Oxa1 family membrane protein insertase
VASLPAVSYEPVALSRSCGSGARRIAQPVRATLAAVYLQAPFFFISSAVLVSSSADNRPKEINVIQAITDALMLIVQPCYDITGNWWIAILLFTIITKIILFPMSLWCQWNSIVMVKLMPALNRLKVKFYGDKETIGEKQNEMYKQHHYHPMLSLVPLLVQVLILFGLVDVIHVITDNGAPGTEFLGLIPVEDGGASWIMPVLAGLSAVIMGFAQNRINPLQREQSKAEKNMTNGLSIGLSLFLGIFVAAGMCFYWVVSNLSAIFIQALCNVCIRPAKHIDYDDLAESRRELEELESIDGAAKKKWWQPDPLAKREKRDYKRFFKTIDKHIVFYSEGSGFYKYFKGVIQYLLEHSDGVIHYVTNDPNDQIFKIAQEQPRIRPYYIGQKRAITLMMKMDADVVVLTLEDLDSFYIKRSYVRDDIDYVFVFHHMTSTHLVARRESYDNYDVLLCAGPHQMAEIRVAEKLRGLPAKRLVEAGYPLLDEEIEAFGALSSESRRPVVLIGPSWQEDCILDSCIEPMLNSLLGHGWKVIVRPHPEYVKRYGARWNALQAKFEGVPEDDLYFEGDFSSNSTVFSADVLITDWSSVACEFSFSTLKPSIFVNTKMKVGNPHYEELGIVPTDISLRDEVGVSIDPADVGKIDEIIADLLANRGQWNDKIKAVRDATIYNIGNSANVEGEFLLDLVLQKQQRKALAAKGGNDAE